MRIFLIFLLFTGFSFRLSAQNLVPNPSFEDNDGSYKVQSDPTDRRSFDKNMRDWTCIAKNSVDISNAKKLRPNEFLEIPPHSGNSIVGMTNFCDEAIQAKLTRTIKKGEEIYVEVWYAYSNVKNAPQITVGSSAFGVDFTEKPVHEEECAAKCTSTTFRHPQNTPLTNKKWQLFAKKFTAQTDLNYIQLGFFLKETSYKAAYYYFDDVRVIAASQYIAPPQKDTVVPPPPKKELATAAKGEVFVFEAVQFETAKADLLPASFAELNKIVAAFLKNATLKLEVQGHTDNVGGFEKNQILSEQRAKSVCDYLIFKGVPSQHLSPKGFGESQPISDNTSPEGRAKNRRVAFRVL